MSMVDCKLHISPIQLDVRIRGLVGLCGVYVGFMRGLCRVYAARGMASSAANVDGG